MSNTSVLGLAPPVGRPQIDADTSNQILRATAFGAVKAVVGSSHLFEVEKTEKKTIKQADGKTKDYDVKTKSTTMRAVRDLHAHAMHPVQWVALGTTLIADTEQDLLTLIYAQFGGPEAMRKAGKRVVYCAETLEEIELHVVKLGEVAIVKEKTLLSDRHPAE